jgi:hypothetical protein
MLRNGFRSIFGLFFLFSVLIIAAPIGSAQTPNHPAGPGEVQPIPLYPPVTTPLAYSWEIGKHRTQKFGDMTIAKPSKEVRKLIKMKQKEMKEQQKIEARNH